MLTITPSMAVQIYTKLLTLFCIIFLFVYFQCINTEDECFHSSQCCSDDDVCVMDAKLSMIAGMYTTILH
jgi:hypothetical protein